MRTLRLSLVGAVILMLLGGLGGAAMAQEEGQSPLVTHVTGTIIDTSYDDSMAEITYAPGDVNHVNGASYAETYVWDDPRLPADKKLILNFVTYPDAGARFMVTRTSLRLDGPEGSWVGTGVGLMYPDGYIFEGEMPQQPDPVEPPAE